jgi:hypothetical protein
MRGDKIPQDYGGGDYNGSPSMGYVPSYSEEEKINNIVGQIDPQRILDNLNHALKGEYYSKEEGTWLKVGDELINDAGRGWIISFFTSIMNNASTMGIIDEKQFSYLMEGIINTVTREFRCNLEKFGFVSPGKGYEEGRYENKGSPNTSRMSTISEMIYQRAFIIYSRSLKGSESQRIFKSLSMSDNMGFNTQMQMPKKNWISRIMGGK